MVKFNRLVFCWAIALILALSFVGCFAYLVVTENYEYNSAVRSHMENAYYSADPDTMRSELVLAIEGMRSLGLTDEMYSKWLPWEKVPQNQMAWQYKHMDSILTRVDEFKAWELSQAGSSSSQQMQDVYTQKLDNVRSFILNGGWSDDVAQGAYSVNYYLFPNLLGAFSRIGAALFFILGFVVIMFREL